MEKEVWEALLEAEPSLKHATNVRVIQGKPRVFHDVIIPGQMVIEFDLPEGVEPPGQGIITSGAGEKPKVERVKGKIRVATKAKDGVRESDEHLEPDIRDIKPAAKWPNPKK